MSILLEKKMKQKRMATQNKQTENYISEVKNNKFWVLRF